jgi:hypothetical protein
VRKLVELVMNDLDMKALIEPNDSSVAFESEHLRDVPRCKTRDQLYRLALGQVTADNGLFLEFGVYKDAAKILAKSAPLAGSITRPTLPTSTEAIFMMMY